MLGLPSTTEVMRAMPKKAFYENLKLKPQEKKLFTSQIEKLILANSIKPSTMNIKEGDKHQEILVLQVNLRQKEIAGSLLETIARQNHHPLVFVCCYQDELCVCVYRQRLYYSEWLPADSLVLSLNARTVDELWDAICAQIALGEETDIKDGNLDAQLSLQKQISTLESEIIKLTDRSRKERQPARKNRLFEESRAKKQELEQLKAGM